MKNLITKSCEEIMTTLYKPTVFAVEGLISQGLYILAGPPKVGKSWLALELCLAISKGEKLLDRPTRQGSALYFCLEDSWQRIQSRLYELTDEPSEKLHFALKADTIGDGMCEQIVKFKSEHDDLRLVVIDTLQMVRSETDSSYGSDYAELIPLKALAETLGISIVLVHHLRKAHSSCSSPTQGNGQRSVQYDLGEHWSEWLCGRYACSEKGQAVWRSGCAVCDGS